MITWKAIDTAIKAAVSDSAGGAQVRWRWEPSKIRAKTTVKLRRSPVRTVGVDSRRRTFQAQSGRLYAAQVGQRTFSLEIRCETDKGHPTDDAPVAAADVLAQILTRLGRPAVIDALRVAGTCVAVNGPIVAIDFKVADREYEAARVELTMHCADVDPDGDDYWIERVNATLKVTTPDDEERTVPVET